MSAQASIEAAFEAGFARVESVSIGGHRMALPDGRGAASAPAILGCGPCDVRPPDPLGRRTAPPRGSAVRYREVEQGVFRPAALPAPASADG